MVQRTLMCEPGLGLLWATPAKVRPHVCPTRLLHSLLGIRKGYGIG